MLQRHETNEACIIADGRRQGYNKDGHPHACRALLDSGFQVNFLSEFMVKTLVVAKLSANIPVIGIGGAKSHIR